MAMASAKLSPRLHAGGDHLLVNEFLHADGSLLHAVGSLLHAGRGLLHADGSLLHAGSGLLHAGRGLLHAGSDLHAGWLTQAGWLFWLGIFPLHLQCAALQGDGPWSSWAAL